MTFSKQRMKIVMFVQLILLTFMFNLLHRSAGFVEDHRYFDFIIVGNGIAGSLVADRLSENENWTVLILETAEDTDSLLKNSSILPLKPLKEYKKYNFFNWDSVLQYLENEKGEATPDENSWKNVQTIDQHKNIIKNGYDEAGINYIADDDAAKFLGVHNSPAARTYQLRRIPFKSNLKIIQQAYVTFLDIDSNGFVRTVYYARDGNRNIVLTAKPRKEVILSAGPIISPKILMLSGIGPEKHLNDIGIKPVCNLQVGQNLMDHIVIPYFVKLPCVESWHQEHTKPFDYITLTTVQLNAEVHEDIMNTCRIVNCKDTLTMRLLLEEVSDEIKLPIFKELENHSILLVGIHNTKPTYKGEVKLASRDPFAQPIISYDRFYSRRDIETLIKGIRLQQRILESPIFTAQQFRQITPYLDKCAGKIADSDEFWECYIRNAVTPFEDPVGTVKMGRMSDLSAVVDACFQVFTTYNLRVIDESVIPFRLNGPSSLHAAKIGQKGAELIIADYLK